jgi:hypothetical protein
MWNRPFDIIRIRILSVKIILFVWDKVKFDIHDFRVVNTIDFDFIFAHASFEDNMTIYMCLIITFTLFFAAMIWAFLKDRKDIKEV